MITIRHYQSWDAPELWNIFYHTIRHINRRDYSQAQVCAWASDHLDPALWQQKMDDISPYIAELEGRVVGYADLQTDGLIDHFFCHYQYQGRCVGGQLMEHIFAQSKAQSINRLHSEVSITARPFYQRFGFVVNREQMLEIRGARLKNFVMEKFAG
ncbi:GNAT family N-acetyltransferase [Porticoccaceae bacterium]|nr:GNAT family N-acetyltransferase [Porticoccaceae bacterium]